MNVYDFDKTIYKGDSTIDFYRFCLRRSPSLIRYLFRQGGGAVLYLLGFCDKTAFKEHFFSFLRGIRDPECMVKEFWDRHMHKIQPWYIQQMQAEDVIISASPAFLLQEATKRLGVATVIASNVDISTGRYTGKNCYGQEKVNRFIAAYPDAIIDAFYSDSLSDAPLGRMAKKGFLVKGDTLCSTNWQ